MHGSLNVKFLQEETLSCVKWIFRRVWWEDLDWMHLDQYKVQWRSVVDAVMKLGVPKQSGGGVCGGYFLTTCTGIRL